jgi:hypothetical protein
MTATQTNGPSGLRPWCSKDTVRKIKVWFGTFLQTSCPRKSSECDYFAVSHSDAAQAVELIRALRHQLHEMTTRLAWVECQDVSGRKGRAARMEAAGLRREIKEAQALIDRLERRYLNGHERTQQRPTGRQRRAPLDCQP